MVIMRGKGQKGFTILETMLFLSISALLFATLVFGILYMVSRARFSDAMSDVRTVIQSQYEEVRSGINSRGAQTNPCPNSLNGEEAAGVSSCLLLGKIIIFDQGGSSVRINYVVSSIKLSTDELSKMGDQEAISKSNPRMSTYARESNDLKWGASFVKGFDLVNGTDGGRSYQSIAILRSPISSNILVYALSGDYSNLENNLPARISESAPGVPVALIIKNPNISGAPGGAVCVNSGSSSANVNTAIPINPGAGFTKTSTERANLEAECQR